MSDKDEARKELDRLRPLQQLLALARSAAFEAAVYCANYRIEAYDESTHRLAYAADDLRRAVLERMKTLGNFIYDGQEIP